MRRIEVVKDQAGQKLWFRCPEGRPSATPSVGLKDSTGTVIAAAATTYVTLDPVDTTVGDAGAGIAARAVPLTSSTGVRVGAEYRITNALGQYEDVQVTGVGTSEVLLGEPLEHAYAAGSLFFSCEFYRTLQDAEVADYAELNIATAAYSVTDAQTAPLLQAFDVVLHPLRNRNPLTDSAVKRSWPDIAGQEWTEQRGDGYRAQRQEAWDRVCDALYTLGDSTDTKNRRRPAAVVSAENFFGWALAELAVILQEGGVEVIRGIDKLEALRRLDERVAKSKATAIASITWYDADEDESLDDETEASPLRTHFVA